MLAELERRAEALLAGTRALVSSSAHDEPEEGWGGRLAEADRDRRRLSELLKAEEHEVHVVLANHAELLMECMHEALLEFDLAVALGPEDPLGRQAAGRARNAACRFGPALLRALSFLVDDRCGQSGLQGSTP